ncbi:MAG: ParA family protein [Nitrospinae bacterium]|nr:ParA family protein [Nitrospinota bacterium]
MLTIAISNQKGGVGKTTTAINLGACLALSGKRTLIIDIDPQANTTSGLGLDPNAENTIYTALVEENADNGCIKPTIVDNLHVLSSDINLAAAEIELSTYANAHYRLKGILNTLRDKFDFILIDCPPALGFLTINALVASDSVLIPLQTEYFALEGLGKLMNTINRIRDSYNPSLEIEGLLFTMYDKRTSLSNQVIDEIKKNFTSHVFETVIPRNIRLSEAPSHGLPISLYDTKSKGADAYVDLAREIITRRKSYFEALKNSGLAVTEH